jgi:protein SCO1/2
VPQRVRLVLVGVFACLFAGFIGDWAATFKAAGDSRLTPDRAVGYSGAARPPGAKVPQFRLRDQDGRAVTPALHAGKPAIYAFIYSHCDDVCPVEVQQIRGAMDQLGRDVPVIGISVDPRGDTRNSARAFLIKQHMTGRMRFALGSERELRPIWRAFGVAPQTEREDHSASVVLVDRRGFQKIGYAFSFLRVDGLEADLRRIGA